MPRSRSPHKVGLAQSPALTSVWWNSQRGLPLVRHPSLEDRGDGRQRHDVRTVGRQRRPDVDAKPVFDESWHPDYSAGTTFDGQKMNLRTFLEMSFNPLKDYLWPIPNAEYIANTGIEQNPYY